MLKYKGYTGHATYDDEARIFHGEVQHTRDVITFQGRSVEELETAFRDSIDDYLAWCAERGKTPDKPYSGQFVLRIPPALHRQLAEEASQKGKSLNTIVVEQLQPLAAQGRPQHPQRPTRKTLRHKARRADS
jgi:predicted HicB family RNase H-like nuclease